MRLMEKDGYILAVITGVTYLMAFFYILARANFYNVPLEMMSFDFFQLTRAAISIFMFSLGFVTSSLVVLWLLTAKTKKSKFLYFLLMVFLVPLLLFFWYGSMNETAGYLMAALFLVVFTALFFVINRLRKIDSVTELFDFDYKYFFSLVRVRVILFGLVIFILISTMYASSYTSVKWNNDYDVFTKGGEYYALINASTDSVIVKKIINKELSDGFYIFKIKDLNAVEVRNRDIRELPRNDSTQPTELPAGFL